MRLVPPVLVCLLLAGCGALSAVSDATEELEAFTLATPATAAVNSGSAHIVVSAPAATGAIATDRILVKPQPLQAAYLPGARWIDPAPVMVQSLLTAALQQTAGFRLVSRDDAGLTPDYLLLLDLGAFQLEAPTVEGGLWTVRVQMTATLVRDEDRQILSTRSFAATATTVSDAVPGVVAAFDSAARDVVGPAVTWVIGATR